MFSAWHPVFPNIGVVAAPITSWDVTKHFLSRGQTKTMQFLRQHQVQQLDEAKHLHAGWCCWFLFVLWASLSLLSCFCFFSSTVLSRSNYHYPATATHKRNRMNHFFNNVEETNGSTTKTNIKKCESQCPLFVLCILCRVIFVMLWMVNSSQPWSWLPLTTHLGNLPWKQLGAKHTAPTGETKCNKTSICSICLKSLDLHCWYV